MPNSPPDRITRLRLKLRAPSALARALLPRSSRMFQQALYHQLGTLLSRYSSLADWRLPCLVLDLGVLPAAQFEIELARRLLAALEERLDAHFGQESAPTIGTFMAISKTIAASDLSGGMAGYAEKFSSPQHGVATLADLQQYLCSGYAPPCLRQVLSGNVDAWFHVQLEVDAERGRAMLATLSLQPTAMLRLFTLFTTSTLTDIAGLPPGDDAALQHWAAQYLKRETSDHSFMMPSAGTGTWRLPSSQTVPPEAVSWPVQIKRAGTEPELQPETMQVDNAGLLLLWPLLPGLLRRWDLLEHDWFVDSGAQLRAVCWIDAWLWQDKGRAEWRTPFTKLLCGWPLDAPLDPWVELDSEVTASLDAVLASLPRQVPGWQRCSPQDIRNLFLLRPGVLSLRDGRWRLSIESDASDILLHDLPWPITQLSMPWMEMVIEVNWL